MAIDLSSLSAGSASGLVFGKTSSVSGMSGSFLETLNGQIAEWVRAMADSKITSYEAEVIAAGGSLEDYDADSDTSESVATDAAASLLASTEINDVSNTMNFIYNMITQENELYDKASQIMTG